MIDLYLKTKTEEDMKTNIPWLVNNEGNWITASHKWAFDPIGPIVIELQVINENMEIVKEAVLDTNFHANLRLIDETLVNQVPNSIQVTVNSPSRKWF